MATFKVEVKQIVIQAHPDPEVTKLEVGQIDDFRVVVGKGIYKTGDHVAYIPEGALVPEFVLERLNLVGKLAGSKKNRVKPMKLRGVMSQGLVYPAKSEWMLGEDVQNELQIMKYEPPIPAALSGEVNSHPLVSLTFDIENLKAHPDLFKEGEEVVFTEKIHGTFLCIGLPLEGERKEDMLDGKFFVSSKGLASRGLYLKDNEKNTGNSYLKAAKDFNLGQMVENIASNLSHRPSKYYDGAVNGTVWLMGELFGLQELKYGITGGALQFRAFAVKVGNRYIDRDLFEAFCAYNKIPMTPVLYRGPYDKTLVKQYTDGKETITGKESHIREGIVITPTTERFEYALSSRLALKSISDAYLGQTTGEELS